MKYYLKLSGEEIIRHITENQSDFDAWSYDIVIDIECIDDIVDTNLKCYTHKIVDGELIKK